MLSVFQIAHESANAVVANGLHSDNSLSEDMSASDERDHSSTSDALNMSVNNNNFDTDPITYNVDHCEKDPKQEELDNMWQQLEGAMIQSYDEVKERLMDYGVGDGDEDSESEEGHLWRMIQGDSPYMLELT